MWTAWLCGSPEDPNPFTPAPLQVLRGEEELGREETSSGRPGTPEHRCSAWGTHQRADRRRGVLIHHDNGIPLGAATCLMPRSAVSVNWKEAGFNAICPPITPAAGGRCWMPATGNGVLVMDELET